MQKCLTHSKVKGTQDGFYFRMGQTLCSMLQIGVIELNCIRLERRSLKTQTGKSVLHVL
jgi:hypothetical protein